MEKNWVINSTRNCYFYDRDELVLKLVIRKKENTTLKKKKNKK
jgi:hypothetical protein